MAILLRGLLQPVYLVSNESLFQQEALGLVNLADLHIQVASLIIDTSGDHRLAKSTTIVLEIIEVQSRGYLGEDDIVRFEDTDVRAQR